MAVIVFLFLILNVLSRPVLAQWMPTSNPCTGGTVYAFASIGSTLYTGIQSYGVCRSVDNGVTWVRIGQGALAKQTVSSLAALPDSSGDTVLFAGTVSAGVFLTRDKGDTWMPVNGDVKSGKAITWGISALTTMGNTIFAATCTRTGIYGAGVFKSKDLGKTWTKSIGDIYKRYNGEVGFSVYSLTHIGRILVAGTLYGTVRSKDSGDTWDPMTNGLPVDKSSYTGEVRPFSVQSLLAVDKTLFAAVGDDGIYESLDSGRFWKKPSAGLSGYINTLSRSGQVIFAGAGGAYSSFCRVSNPYPGGIYASSLDGASWRKADSGIQADEVYFVASSGSSLLAGSTEGLFTSANGANTWKWLSHGIAPSASPTGIAVNGETIFVKHQDTIYGSFDRAGTWTPLRSGLPSKFILTSLCADGSSFLAGGLYGVFKWKANSNTWVNAGAGLPSELSFHPLACSPTRLVVGTEHNGIYLSTNGGDTWFPFNAGILDSASIESVAMASNRIYAGIRTGGFYQTALDRGSWERTGLKFPNNEPILEIAIMDSSILAAINHNVTGVVKRSIDNGVTWNSIDEGLGKYGDSYSIHSFLTVGNNAFSTNTEGVYLLRNNANKWENVSDGLPNGNSVWALARIGDTLYTGIGDNGLWKRALSEMNVAAPTVNVMHRSLTSSKTEISVGDGMIWFPNEKPNPFSSLELHSIEGRRRVLYQIPNRDGLLFSTFHLPPGVYGYTLKSGDHKSIGRFVLVRSFSGEL